MSQSKGGILSKACDYIQELRQANNRLHEGLHDVKRVQMDNEILRQQVRQPEPSFAKKNTASPRFLRKKYLKEVK